MPENFIFDPIKVLVFDIDGVFTDTSILITEDGDLLRTINTRDGYALRRAKEAGLTMAVITGGRSKGVENRFISFGIEIFFSGILDKGTVFHDLVRDQGWDMKEVLYIGDDIPDVPCIMAAGVGACPQDAVPEVKAVSDFISDRKGGDFCVRDLIERILKQKNKW